MILGQLRIWARATTYAALCESFFDYSKGGECFDWCKKKYIPSIFPRSKYFWRQWHDSISNTKRCSILAWTNSSKQLFKSFNNCLGARLLHVLSFKHTSPPLVSLVSAFKTKTTLSSVRFSLHWERGFHRKVHNPCPPLRQVLSYPLDRACLTG